MASPLTWRSRSSRLTCSGSSTRPCASQGKPQSSIPIVRPGPVVGKRLDILLAEDNLINQKIAVRLLEKAGHRVRVTGNGKEALAALEREAFDLVLMDVQMPEMGGFEATGIIREREKGSGRHVPVIAMTAHAMKGDRERCLAAGMDDYLAKPVQREELLRVLGTLAAVPAIPVPQ